MAPQARPGVLSLIRTARRLGVANILRVIGYRLLKRSGYFRQRYPVADAALNAAFVFRRPEKRVEVSGSADILDAADKLVEGRYEYFDSLPAKLHTPPQWFVNPYTGHEFKDRKTHWSKLADFDPEFGDIKTVWEPSRLSWCMLLVQAALISGDEKYIDTANLWLGDWLAENPCNAGPNWMCGQETSIRLIHILLADALLARYTGSRSTLDQFVLAHCDRIGATTSYAIAQDNNHSISEAAGLYLGGDWLSRHSPSHSAGGRRIRKIGARMLERQVARLVFSDGSFAQYSTNYHRLLLDTLSVVEWWRRGAQLPEFSDVFYERARCATDWLIRAVEPSSGDAPNIGANDGAHVYRFSAGAYRDYRPTIQLSAAIFLRKRAIEKRGPWDASHAWLDIEQPTTVVDRKQSSLHQSGGFAFLHHSTLDSHLACRGASRQFRPSQADALHVDVWWSGENIARDAGTYSYAAELEALMYFKGTESHNTVQFDDRDQMRSIGRFLFVDWVVASDKMSDRHGSSAVWAASYTDYLGCSHQRSVEETGDGWRVIDRISGPFEKAVLRWRLHPGWDWKLDADAVRSPVLSIQLEASTPFASIKVMDGRESRHYLEETALPVLSATVSQGDCAIVSTFRANDR